MCVFVALWASKGVAGFMRTRERASKGGGGFMWARKSSPRGPVSSLKREIVRPARSQHPTFGVYVLAGRVFRGRAAGGAVLGELLRANWPCVDLGCDAVHFRLAAMGVLRHAKPSDGVSTACRRLGWRHSPRLVAARPRLEVVWPPKCRPIGRKSLKMACFG